MLNNQIDDMILTIYSSKLSDQYINLLESHPNLKNFTVLEDTFLNELISFLCKLKIVNNGCNKKQITSADILKIHELYKSGLSIPDIALKLGFTEGQIKGSYITRYRMQKIIDTEISLDINEPLKEFEFEKIMYVLNNNDGRGMKSKMMSLLNISRKQIEEMCQFGVSEDYCKKIKEIFLKFS